MYGYRRQEQYLLLINTYCSAADMGLTSSIGYYLSKVFWYVCHLYNSIICKIYSCGNWKTLYLNIQIPQCCLICFARSRLEPNNVCASAFTHRAFSFLHPCISYRWERHFKIWWIQGAEAICVSSVMQKYALCQPKTGSQSCLPAWGELQHLVFSPKIGHRHSAR